MDSVYHQLPSTYDSQKAALLVEKKTARLQITGDYYLKDPIIKAKSIVFETAARLIVDNIDLPWIALYADTWSFFGPAEVTRKAVNLDGADGAKVIQPPWKFPGPGRNGDDGLPGMPGRDALYTPRLPSVYVFAQQMLVNDRPALPSDVEVMFMFDGLQGGNGGIGSDGTNGMDGGKGEPSESGPFWCNEGPGRGGRGGNAGPGGQPGYGGNGGDAPTLTFFLNPDCERAFSAAKYSLKGGRPGHDGIRGKPGKIGHGGDEGEPKGNCFPRGRKGDDGQIPRDCPHPTIEHYNGLDNDRVILLYDGFDELGD